MTRFGVSGSYRGCVECSVEARGRTIRHQSARGQLQAKEQVSPGTAAAAAAGGTAVNIKQGLHRCQPGPAIDCGGGNWEF